VVQHPGAEVDTGQRHALGVAVEVQAGADADLEHVPDGLPAHPLPAVAEQLPIEERHLLVVGTGVVVPVAAQPLHVLRASHHS
jgi:hypothetical protein